MGWGMNTKPTPEQELKKYKFNPAKSSSWLWFMEKTIALDKRYGAPKGWHWFMGFHCLQKQEKIPKFSTKKTDKTIPDEHWLKIKSTRGGVYKTMEEWAQNIQVSKKITKINFSKPFNKAIDFSNFIFPIDVSFENATFVGKADFSDTLFLKDACFNDAKFLNDIHFDDAMFFETADFEKAIFHQETSSHLKTAKFRNTTFKKIANFRNATFWKYANFKGATFDGRTAFQRANFKFNAPRFYGATFNNEMTFFGILLPKFKRSPDEKIDVKLRTTITDIWDEIKEKKIAPADISVNIFFRIWDNIWYDIEKKRVKRNERIQENQNSYENTSMLLGNQKKYHDQHLFFRQEMRCRQKLEHPLIKLFYWLYKWLANYGYGVGHAFIAWLVHIALGVAALMYFTNYYWAYNPTEFWKILNCATPVSFANANPYAFFSFDGGKLAGCYTKLGYLLPRAFGIIKIIQIVIGVALLFLVLLTLRIRFRLK